jgi:hypothetical protein
VEQQILVDSRFSGPPNRGHGGYLSGLLARHFDAPVEITMTRPIPLNRAIQLEWFEHVVLLCDGGDLIATGERKAFDLATPRSLSYGEAVDATRRGIRPEKHPFPGCFVCGPERKEGDGLRIFPGPTADGDRVAAPWIPDASLADADGRVRCEFVHAALDCPGGFAAALGNGMRPAVLGRFTARIDHPVFAGERYVVVGWRLGGTGRKHEVGSALYAANGERRGVARATWIERQAA